MYDRHSEANLAGKWNSVNDLENYLEEFKQHSLRNPIVEQVVAETLRVVKDIWDTLNNKNKISSNILIEENISACWSVPIISAEGTLYGTFATYYRKPKSPTDDEIKIVENS